MSEEECREYAKTFGASSSPGACLNLAGNYNYVGTGAKAGESGFRRLTQNGCTGEGFGSSGPKIFDFNVQGSAVSGTYKSESVTGNVDASGTITWSNGYVYHLQVDRPACTVERRHPAGCGNKLNAANFPQCTSWEDNNVMCTGTTERECVLEAQKQTDVQSVLWRSRGGAGACQWCGNSGDSSTDVVNDDVIAMYPNKQCMAEFATTSNDADREDGDRCTLSSEGPESAFSDRCSDAGRRAERPSICQQLYHGCIRVQTESHGVCVYYNRGGELAKDRDGMFLVCAKSLPETTTSTSTLPQMTTSTTSSTRPCIAHTTRYCMSYDAVHEDVRMKPCAADKSCERFMRQGSAFEAKCARGRCLTVQSAPRPEYPNCHSMFFEACNPSDQYQQWNKVLLSGQSGNAWKNLATGTEFSPVSKKDGKTIMACKSSQVESSAFYSTFPERALGL